LLSRLGFSFNSEARFLQLINPHGERTAVLLRDRRSRLFSRNGVGSHYRK
jgi:hypothetical protein